MVWIGPLDPTWLDSPQTPWCLLRLWVSILPSMVHWALAISPGHGETIPSQSRVANGDPKKTCLEVMPEQCTWQLDFDKGSEASDIFSKEEGESHKSLSCNSSCHCSLSWRLLEYKKVKGWLGGGDSSVVQLWWLATQLRFLCASGGAALESPCFCM